MARRYTDGAETGDLSRVVLNQQSNNLNIVSNVKRTGTYSYDLRWQSDMYTVTFSSMTEFYLRFGAYVNGTAQMLVYWMNGGSLGGSLRINAFGTSSGTITMYDGSTGRVTSSAFTVYANEWHVYEIHVKIAASPNGIFEAKFDGTTVISWTGATNAQAGITRFLFGQGGSSINQDNKLYIDDIALNDTSGLVDNSWCGDGGVLAAAVPNGAGNYTDLIASTGNAYQCVDEIPANGTDYVYESTVDKKSTYTMSDPTIPAGATIARVWVELYAQDSAAAGDKIATLLRSGSSDNQSSDLSLTTGWARYVGPEYLTDPADSAAWTSTKINALEVGAVVR